MKKYIILLIILPLLTLGQKGSGRGGYGGDPSSFGKKNKSSYFRGNVSGHILDKKTGEGLYYANISIINSKWNKILQKF